LLAELFCHNKPVRPQGQHFLDGVAFPNQSVQVNGGDHSIILIC
jgi:hypothetical protein